MYNNLKRLYQSGKLKEEDIHNAVSKHWITSAEAAEILGREETT